MYKYLIFDLDDTLIDNTANVKFAFQELLKTFEINFTERSFLDWQAKYYLFKKILSYKS